MAYRASLVCLIAASFAELTLSKNPVVRRSTPKKINTIGRDKHVGGPFVRHHGRKENAEPVVRGLVSVGPSGQALPSPSTPPQRRMVAQVFAKDDARDIGRYILNRTAAVACENACTCKTPGWAGNKPATVNYMPLAIPEEKLLARGKTPAKRRIVSTLIAGNASTYGFDTQEAYYAQYAASFFAHTKKKAGWDCMRHYEIIAAGAVPLFENLSAKPPCVSRFLPVKLLQRGEELFKELFPYGDVEGASREDRNMQLNKLTNQWLHSYWRLHSEVVDHAHATMTTRTLAKAFVSSTGVRLGRSKILYLSSAVSPFLGARSYQIRPPTPFNLPDCVSALLFHGLRREGHEVVDVPRLDYMYQSWDKANSNGMYANGYTYAGHLPDEGNEITAARANWENMLRGGEFEHVVLATTGGHFIFLNEYFGIDGLHLDGEGTNYPLGKDLFDLVEAGVGSNPTRTSTIFGDDSKVGDFFTVKVPEFLQRGHVFVREGFSDMACLEQRCMRGRQ